jgi:hypothetical protein
VEKPVGQLHDVVFREAGDLAAAVRFGVLEGVAHDLFGAGARDELKALVDLIGLAVLDTGVEVLFVFADDHHVHHGVLGRDKGAIRAAGADVGVEP